MLDFYDGKTDPGFRHGSNSLCRVLQIRPDYSLKMHPLFLMLLVFCLLWRVVVCSF